MKLIACFTRVTVVFAILYCDSLFAAESYLDNGTIKLGVELNYGGSITTIRHAADGRNLINTHDLGRLVQQSYYSGPIPYDPNNTTHPSWPNWPWNPIQAGDVYLNRATLLYHTNDGQEIYVKSRPIHWALNNVPAESIMESWYRLDGSVIKVRNRLSNHRSDHNWYGGFGQEIPAIYTIGALGTLRTYTGSAPFTGGATQTIDGPILPQPQLFKATEGWAALLDRSDFGLGVFHPTSREFVGGFHGERGIGTSEDDSTGYVSPIHTEVLDHNIVYDFSYDLIIGSLNHIRDYAYGNRRDLRPNDRFVGSRRHWYPVGSGVTDDGIPDGRGLRVSLNSSDPQIWGPWTSFNAVDVPVLMIEMAIDSSQAGPGTAEIFWARMGGSESNFTPEQRISFNVVKDGQYHWYRVAMSNHPLWAGLITRLRLDPVFGGAAGDHAYIRNITFHAEPLDEPRVVAFDLPPPNPANDNCPSGFFAAAVDDGPGPSLTPGSFGMELLLDNMGDRLFTGGLNFGGLIDSGQPGFAAFLIANPANEFQKLNINLTGSSSDASPMPISVRVRVSRRTSTSTDPVFEATQTISLSDPFVASVDLPPAFYVATVEPLTGDVGGRPEGQFFFSLTTSFVNRPGGGFLGGAVVGGYHAAHPFGGVSGFAAFCLATPHNVSLRVVSAPTYGPNGARDLRLRVLDAQQRVVALVPGG